MGPVLFNIFINDLDDGIEGALIRFADDTKLGGIANTLEDKLNFQKDLDRLEHWALSNKMQFSGRKSKALYLGRRNQMHKYRIDSVTYRTDGTCLSWVWRESSILWGVEGGTSGGRSCTVYIWGKSFVKKLTWRSGVGVCGSDWVQLFVR